jgi:molecular chaperone DnaK (HSP70)
MCSPTSESKDDKPRGQPHRRAKRDKNAVTSAAATPTKPARNKRRSRALEKHGGDADSGGIVAMLPSLIAVGILGFAVMAQFGFRGRASVAGIDLGTTNSVICVQAPAKGVGVIECIKDPSTGSPIIPSVVSFLEASERPVGPSSKVKSKLDPHPTHVVVGQTAKRRIDSHPHHTLYHAKRVLGRPLDDHAVAEMRAEVEFEISEQQGELVFRVPDSDQPISPQLVGSYIVNHLMQITQKVMGHDNVKSAVICVPAKFNDEQRIATYQAFREAGVTVARIVEEPTAAALAYGLHRKEGVDYILVYDFGGGTLDVSLLHVSDGFVDVMGSDGDDRLGGADFDAAVAHFLLEHRGGKDIVHRVTAALKHLTDEMPLHVDLEDKLSSSCPALATVPLCTTSSFHTLGEQLKIGLSDYPDHDGSVQAECLSLPADIGHDTLSLDTFCSSLVPVTLTLTSQEYDETVQSLYDRSVLPIERLLSDLDLTSEDIDEIVMVGGTTRMPQIRSLVRQTLPTAAMNTHIDPDITVAYGAASVID